MIASNKADIDLRATMGSPAGTNQCRVVIHAGSR